MDEHDHDPSVGIAISSKNWNAETGTFLLIIFAVSGLIIMVLTAYMNDKKAKEKAESDQMLRELGFTEKEIRGY